MGWRVAKSLDTILQQVNEKWPGRNKENDGTIGDEAHSARQSDHNPNSEGVVCARDITHDPAHGFDSYAFADMLLRNKDDRIKYVISNRRIASGTGQDHPAWEWRHYSGSNPHDHHVHISVKSDAAHYDDSQPWKIDDLGVEPTKPPPPVANLPRTLRLGDRGADVAKLQQLLFVDGIFGSSTKNAVEDAQLSNGLVVDGVVGPQTWSVLLKAAPATPVSPVTPPVVPPARADQLRLSGKVSWFGGPADTGVAPGEGLAFINSVSEQPTIFLPAQPPGTTGLARRLDPEKFYIACRWDYKRFPKSTLLHHQATVSAPKTGRSCSAVWPADWGPNENTGRVADISPGLMAALGITTDDMVEVVYPASPVTPKEPPMADTPPTTLPPVIVTAPPPAQPARDWAHTGLAAIVVAIFGWLGITVPDKLAAPNPVTDQATIENVVQATLNPQAAGLILKDPKIRESVDLALLKAFKSGVPGEIAQTGAGFIPGVGGGLASILRQFQPMIDQAVEAGLQKRLEQNQQPQPPKPPPAPRR